MEDRPGEKMESWTRANGLPRDLNQRFSTAIMNFNAELSGCRTGALVQVWMPSQLQDGSMFLQTRGLAFSISGIGDLLALFRCVSCRYQVTTDMSKPHLMDVIGRVFSTAQPELCYDVQRYNRRVYIRADEARQCNVHATLVTPVYLSLSREVPVGVLEVSHHDIDVNFPEIISRLSSCLENIQLYMTDIDVSSVRIGLRSWPVDVSPQEETVVKSKAEVAFLWDRDQAPAGYKLASWSKTGSKKLGQDIETTTGVQQGLCSDVPNRTLCGQPPLPCNSAVPAVRIPSRREYVCKSASGPIARPIIPSMHSYVSRSASGPLNRSRSLMSSEGSTPCPITRTCSLGPNAPPGTDQSFGFAQHFLQQHVIPRSGISSILGLGSELKGSPEIEVFNASTTPTSTLQSAPVAPCPDFLSSTSEVSDVLEREEQNKGQDDTSPDCAKDKEGAAKDGQVEATTSGGQSPKNDNRLGGGAGKRLTFKELQACFGVGLKEAAGQLGICPTTLKRACRRNGVARWPSRQISKLSKAWNQMGYKGSPPAWLIHKVVTGNLKCDNLAFSLNAGLHLGLMEKGTTQAVNCPQPPPTWNVVHQDSISAAAATGLRPEGSTLNLGTSSLQTVPLPASSGDQLDFFDELDGLMPEPTNTLGWSCSGAPASALHALNPAHEARRVFRSTSTYSTPSFGSPNLAAQVQGGVDDSQGQGGDQLFPSLAFDGLEEYTAGSGLTNALNRTLEGVAFGMEVTPKVTELGIAGELF